MQLVLERRPERSAVIAVASPLIAVVLTVVTFAILFAIMGKNPVYAIWVYFIEPLTDPFALQEIAVKVQSIGVSIQHFFAAGVKYKIFNVTQPEPLCIQEVVDVFSNVLVDKRWDIF